MSQQKAEKRKPLTYNHLAAWIAGMTPEQRACEALFLREQGGGQIYGLHEFTDDQVTIDNDGLVGLTELRASGEAEEEIGPIAWRKGQPFMDAER